MVLKLKDCSRVSSKFVESVRVNTTNEQRERGLDIRQRLVFDDQEGKKVSASDCSR